MSRETVERFDPAHEFPIITHGLPYPEVCARHLATSLRCSRPFLVVSRSLGSGGSDVVERLTSAIEDGGGGMKVAGVRREGMRPHTYYSDVLQVVGEVKGAAADCVVTVGGGSLVDGAKAVVLALANNATTLDELDHLLKNSNEWRDGDEWRNGDEPPAADSDAAKIWAPTLPIMCVTTTLSAGEFNPAGGATHDETRHKQLFWPGGAGAGDGGGNGPRVLVVDPGLARSTPERVWLSTGLRAVDHCVETVCSSNPDPRGTECSLRGIGLLIPGLLRCKRDGGDLEARLRCQLGAAESMKANRLYGVHLGGSHGIGHQLGPRGVPHAETTCVCLPAVQKYNARANAPQQAVVLDALWADPDIAATLTKHSLARGGEKAADLGDALDAIIRELGLPRTLAAYGIGRDQLGPIAESSVEDLCCRWNVIPLVSKEQVVEILDECLG